MTDSLEFLRPPVITSWFRDNPVMQTVQSEIREKRKEEPLRVASIGCATGEEPYSLAYLLRKNGQPGRVFAFDIDQQALEQAKSAAYRKANIRWGSKEVPKDEIFEDAESDPLVVQREIRDMVEFSDADFLKDASIGSGEEQFDIVSCRYLLQHFWLDQQLLETAVSRFVDMVKDNGLLLLDKKAIELMAMKSHDSLRILGKHFMPVTSGDPNIWRKIENSNDM